MAAWNKLECIPEGVCRSVGNNFQTEKLEDFVRKKFIVEICKNARFIKAFPGFHQNIYHVFESAQFFQSPLLFTVKQTFTRQMISFAELIFF